MSRMTAKPTTRGTPGGIPLGGFAAVDLDHRLDDQVGFPLDRIPMHIQRDLDGRIFHPSDFLLLPQV